MRKINQFTKFCRFIFINELQKLVISIDPVSQHMTLVVAIIIIIVISGLLHDTVIDLLVFFSNHAADRLSCTKYFTDVIFSEPSAMLCCVKGANCYFKELLP